MIKYEVVIIGEIEPSLQFESGYTINSSERLFLQKEDGLYSLNVSKITHNLVEGEHVVRLNCHARLYSK